MKTKIIILLFLFSFMLNLNSQNLKMVLQGGNTGSIAKIEFSDDGEYFATTTFYDNDVRIWHKTGKLIRVFNNDNNMASGSFCFSYDNKYLGLADGMSFKTINILTGKVITVKPKNDFGSKQLYAISFTPDNKNILIGSAITQTKLFPYEFDEKKFKALLTKTNTEEETKALKNCFLFDNDKKLYILDENANSDEVYSLIYFFTRLKLNIQGQVEYLNRIDLYSLDGKFIKVFGLHNTDPSKYVTKIIFSPDKTNFISYSMLDGLIKVWDYSDGSSSTIIGDPNVISIKFNSSGKLIGLFSHSTFKVCNLSGVFLVNKSRSLGGFGDFSIDKKLIVEASYTPDNKGGSIPGIKTVDFTDNLIKNYPILSSIAYSIKLTDDCKNVIVGSMDGTVNIINLNTGDLVSLVSEKEQWFCFTPDGYWDASLYGGKLVAMVTDEMEVFGVDQFAIKYNRPDIILKRIGFENNDIIDHYYNQFKKRLRKFNLKEENLAEKLEVPEVKIIEAKQNDKLAEITFKLKDNNFNLKLYNIFVNDVPVFGILGKETSGNSQTIKEIIELGSGDNKIEITCTNEKGAESFRALTKINYKKEVKGDLYFIGFGVSNYLSDDITDLEYANKDVTDLKQLFSKQKDFYNNIYTYAYLDKDVKKDNIINAKKLVQNTKVDDTLILFIAGHGLHDNDKENTYYYVTYDTDIKNLSKTAADFDLIENILQEAKARNKLFLMDTCESGELDTDENINLTNEQKVTTLNARSLKRISSNQNKTTTNKKFYSMQKDRFIYNDLARRSGAVVFSSSKGGEFSYEDSRLENGLFTEEIINAFQKNMADTNGDGKITMEELKSFVLSAVSKSSDGKQNPTIDRDNIYQKLIFPVVNE